MNFSGRIDDLMLKLVVAMLFVTSVIAILSSFKWYLTIPALLLAIVAVIIGLQRKRVILRKGYLIDDFASMKTEVQFAKKYFNFVCVALDTVKKYSAFEIDQAKSALEGVGLTGLVKADLSLTGTGVAELRKVKAALDILHTLGAVQVTLELVSRKNKNSGWGSPAKLRKSISEILYDRISLIDDKVVEEDMFIALEKISLYCAENGLKLVIMGGKGGQLSVPDRIHSVLDGLHDVSFAIDVNESNSSSTMVEYLFKRFHGFTHNVFFSSACSNRTCGRTTLPFVLDMFVRLGFVGFLTICPDRSERKPKSLPDERKILLEHLFAIGAHEKLSRFGKVRNAFFNGVRGVWIPDVYAKLRLIGPRLVRFIFRRPHLEIKLGLIHRNPKGLRSEIAFAKGKFDFIEFVIPAGSARVLAKEAPKTRKSLGDLGVLGTMELDFSDRQDILVRTFERSIVSFKRLGIKSIVIDPSLSGQLFMSDIIESLQRIVAVAENECFSVLIRNSNVVPFDDIDGLSEVLGSVPDLALALDVGFVKDGKMLEDMISLFDRRIKHVYPALDLNVHGRPSFDEYEAIKAFLEILKRAGFSGTLTIDLDSYLYAPKMIKSDGRKERILKQFEMFKVLVADVTGSLDAFKNARMPSYIGQISSKKEEGHK